MYKYQKTLKNFFVFSLLFSSQLIEASHLLEEDCHEQKCFICPNGGDDKFIVSSDQEEEEVNYEIFLNFSLINQFSHFSIKLNAPIRAPPFLGLSTSYAKFQKIHF